MLLCVSYSGYTIHVDKALKCGWEARDGVCNMVEVRMMAIVVSKDGQGCNLLIEICEYVPGLFQFWHFGIFSWFLAPRRGSYAQGSKQSG